jgi:predicted Ser/Thr protein kinase
MTSMTTCPDEAELLAVALGEPTDDAIRRHADKCPTCGERVDRLRAEVSALPRDLGEGPAAEANGPVREERGGEPSGEPTAPFPMVTTRDFRGGPPERPVAIGKYVVVDLLDWGGEGEVYRVIDPDLCRELVLKLARHPTDGDEWESLVKEGKVLAELDHINLVRVFGTGVHDGRPFLVMEYVRGSNLEDYVRNGPVTPRRAAELVARLARALALVHRKNVIHRDIKPRNILIDEAGEPRLIDFGLARLRSAWADPFATTWGGTLAYMAPEQARREHDRTGPRSDIFGLGAVLYFLLTGRPPFVGETAEEILDRAQRCEFDAGALRTAGVPRRLERICLKVLAAEPDDRYATAEEFGRALRGFLRRPVLVAIGAALLLIAAPAAVVASWAISPQSHSIIVPPRPEDGGTADLQTLVKVDRQRKFLDLRDALPLRTGDLLWIECRVPRGWRASAFWFDTESRLTELAPIGHEPDGPFERFNYPVDGAATLVGSAGTEFIFVCARPSDPPRLDEVAALFPEGHPWPGLADQQLILLDRDRVAVLGVRGGGPVQASAAREMERTIEHLRLALTERFDSVAGVIFPHRDPAPESDPPTAPHE